MLDYVVDLDLVEDIEDIDIPIDNGLMLVEFKDKNRLGIFPANGLTPFSVTYTVVDNLSFKPMLDYAKGSGSYYIFVDSAVSHRKTMVGYDGNKYPTISGLKSPVAVRSNALLMKKVQSLGFSVYQPFLSYLSRSLGGERMAYLTSCILRFVVSDKVSNIKFDLRRDTAYFASKFSTLGGIRGGGNWELVNVTYDYDGAYCTLGHDIKWGYHVRESETGEEIVFGSTCIKDFFNVDSQIESKLSSIKTLILNELLDYSLSFVNAYSYNYWVVDLQALVTSSLIESGAIDNSSVYAQLCNSYLQGFHSYGMLLPNRFQHELTKHAIDIKVHEYLLGYYREFGYLWSMLVYLVMVGNNAVYPFSDFMLSTLGKSSSVPSSINLLTVIDSRSKLLKGITNSLVYDTGFIRVDGLVDIRKLYKSYNKILFDITSDFEIGDLRKFTTRLLDNMYVMSTTASSNSAEFQLAYDNILNNHCNFYFSFPDLDDSVNKDYTYMQDEKYRSFTDAIFTMGIEADAFSGFLSYIKSRMVGIVEGKKERIKAEEEAELRDSVPYKAERIAPKWESISELATSFGELCDRVVSDDETVFSYPYTVEKITSYSRKRIPDGYMSFTRSFIDDNYGYVAGLFNRGGLRSHSGLGDGSRLVDDFEVLLENSSAEGLAEGIDLKFSDSVSFEDYMTIKEVSLLPTTLLVDVNASMLLYTLFSYGYSMGYKQYSLVMAMLHHHIKYGLSNPFIGRDSSVIQSILVDAYRLLNHHIKSGEFSDFHSDVLLGYYVSAFKRTFSSKK